MSFKTVIDGLEALIKLHADYSGSNVSKADPSIYSSGPGNVAVLLWPGSWTVAPNTNDRRLTNEHGIIVEWSSRIGDSVSGSYTDFITRRQTFTDHLLAYPTLNSVSGVAMWQFGQSQPPVMWADEHGQWWTQVFQITVVEKQTLAIAES